MPDIKQSLFIRRRFLAMTVIHNPVLQQQIPLPVSLRKLCRVDLRVKRRRHDRQGRKPHHQPVDSGVCRSRLSRGRKLLRGQLGALARSYGIGAAGKEGA